MTTAHELTDTIKPRLTFGRPDARPVRAWEAWVSLGTGLLFVLLGGWTVLTSQAWQVDPAVGYTQLLTGAAFLAMAGLQVARPDPANRTHVVIYRVVSFALTLPLLLGVGALVNTWNS